MKLFCHSELGSFSRVGAGLLATGESTERTTPYCYRTPVPGFRPIPLPQGIAGIMLVECIVYIAVFMVVLSLAFMALHQTWLTSKSLRRNAHDIAAALRAGEQWRSDIRQAIRPIETTGGSNEWTMRITATNGMITYRLSINQLTREATSPKSRYIVLENVKSSTMVPDPRRHVLAWRWELELRSKQPKTKLRPLFTFTAVPPQIKNESPQGIQQ